VIHYKLKVGDEIAISLPGRSASGYRWTASVSGDADAVKVTVSLVGADVGAAGVGASAAEKVVVRAERPGAATVLLVQRRPWEKDSEPLRTMRITLTVAQEAG
jgi:predicted secreted protein